ncbi:hypothetical protein VOLCADRAFT_116201 [Volvox carteri f. nagariensis]|uniref:BFN domain-containing protein n=1 Tax=Volvox carteri f. nagariensis TaxID=3068 RepID=D8TK16_VOLCA|nr:uncharacterized protein VOLCADRAFT_116201 [Volvox carteri f. nagariensis]EFJ52169.1 hypothetical protein VOLCADRAFT_116201 [Volvox carteri f. nagariensis]|eukprot:XP_002946943.1 hypothetical protein VOLCADRAFT_116201 [Volvox carteri f. nagariensis]
MTIVKDPSNNTYSSSSTGTTFDVPPGPPSWSRRAALFSLPICAGVLLPGGWGRGAMEALASESTLVLPRPRPLRSLGWSVPSELTVLNDLEVPLKLYWLNYDGDAELFGSLSPGSVFTVLTFESHAWRFVDGTSGATVAEHVMAAGQQIVRVAPSTAAAAGGALAGPSTSRPATSYTYQAATSRPQLGPRGSGTGGGAAAAEAGVAAAPPPGLEELPPPQPPTTAVRSATAGSASDGGVVPAPLFEGFDGLGNEEQQYCLAQLREIEIFPGGGNVLLVLPGSKTPLELTLAGPEALSLVAATGSLEQRRPSTLGTWTRSLMVSGVELRRVCINRMVDGVYYCRIVLSRPDGSLCSVDATPGDSLSMALQLRKPIYVASEVARVHQSVADVFASRRRAMEEAAASGLLDEAAEAEADLKAQAALDSITRGIPSAPRPVRVLQMDSHLDA